MRDVVITGVGIVSPIGVGDDAVWQSIIQRQSGVRRLPELATAGWLAPFGGWVNDFDPKDLIQPRKSIKVMCREIQFGVAAAEIAWQQAGLAGAALDPERVGVTGAAGLLYCDLEELHGPIRVWMNQADFDIGRWSLAAMKEMHPLWMLKYLPNMTACHIGIRYDARGPTNTVAHNEISSLMAVAEATDTIRRGVADVMIAGGSGSRLKLTDLMWRRGAGLSMNGHGDPGAVCRPFDASRSGIVNGEGAAQFVLESREHAERRGARMLARVVSAASRNETAANSMQPKGDAIRRAIVAAVKAAGLSASDIGHVNAHGNSTIDDDSAEAQAIRLALGNVPVTAPKSYFGHLGPGSGAVELAISVLGLQRGLIPPTLNYKTPDPACPVNVVVEPQLAAKPTFVALNHNVTGAAAAVVIAVP